MATYKVGPNGYFDGQSLIREGTLVALPDDAKPGSRWVPVDAAAMAQMEKHFPNGLWRKLVQPRPVETATVYAAAEVAQAQQNPMAARAPVPGAAVAVVDAPPPAVVQDAGERLQPVPELKGRGKRAADTDLL